MRKRSLIREIRYVLGAVLWILARVVTAGMNESAFERALTERPQVFHGLGAAATVRVLSFSHETLSWSAYVCRPITEKGKNTVKPHWKCMATELERSSDGTPQITRGSEDGFLIAVTETNPFLYSYEGVVLASQDAPTLASLKTLATAVGAVIQPLFAGGGAINAFRGGPADDLKDLADNLAKASGYLQTISLFVEELELREGHPSLPGLTPPEIVDVSRRVQAGMDELASMQPKLRSLVCGCFAQWSVILSLVSAPNIKDTQIETARADMAKALSGGLQNCSDPVIRTTCPTGAADPYGILEELAKASPNQVGPLAPREILRQKLLDPTQDSRLQLVVFSSRLDEVLKRRGDVAALLARLEMFRSIAYRTAAAADPDAWDPELLVSHVAFVEPDAEAQRWDKIYPGKLTIKADSSVCPDCARVRSIPGDQKFVLASRRDSFLGVGFGVTFTRIKDPTFGKVSEAIPDSTNTKNVIGKTSEESRAGLLVALGFLRPWVLFSPSHQRGVVEPGIEFGAGVDPKKPAGFLGVGIEILKVARIGFGETWQSINALAPGLQAAQFDSNGKAIPGTGSTVVVDGDIRTRKRTTGRPYVSLVLGLDSLPIFDSKK